MVISSQSQLFPPRNLRLGVMNWKESSGIDDNGLPRPLAVYKRVNAHVVMPIAHDIAAHPAILDVVEGVLRLDIRIYSTEF
jgi:hypothetical protein